MATAASLWILLQQFWVILRLNPQKSFVRKNSIMSANAVEELALQDSADDFQALEEKIYRTIEQLKAAKEARAAAERTIERLRQQVSERDEQIQSMRNDVVSLRKEREEVRTRVEKMLKQIDTLTSAESEA